MRLALDCSWFGPTGIGRVADEVLQRTPEDVTLVRMREGVSCASVISPMQLSRGLARSAADVFWSPGFMPPLRTHGVRCAITVHDLTHLHHYSVLHRTFYEQVIRRLLSSMAIVFTVSDFTRRELLTWSDLPEYRVRRIYNGVDAAFKPDGEVFDLGSPYVLYVGNRRTYKNLPRVLQAFALSGLPEEGVVLALSGEEDNAISQTAAALGLQDAVRHLGFIPEARLPSVYRGASVLAFPSLYEGFGLPVLEAMACGTPVLTSTTTSLAEVAGDAALLVDPQETQMIADGLTTLYTDASVRDNCRRKGLLRAADFTWDDCALQYWSQLRAL